MNNKKILISLCFLFLSLAFFLKSCSKKDEFLPIPATVQFEQNLSAYNIYEGALKDLVPSSDFHLLELNSSLFSNYSEKQRLVKLPAGTQMIMNGDGIPTFPNGTLLIKTFFYFNDERDETLGKQIVETRVLIKKEDLWNVATYIWNEDQTDATLELDGFDTEVNWINSSGSNRIITYHFPNQDECIACHQQNSEVFPIGPTLRNLNIDVTRGNLMVNQLEYLQSVGVFNTFDVSLISKIPNYKDLGLPLSERGRAYLDMNCAHCHNPAAWKKAARRNFDFRFETAIEDTKILNKTNEIKRAVEDGEMPYLGTTVIDDEGIDLVIQYLNSL